MPEFLQILERKRGEEGEAANDERPKAPYFMLIKVVNKRGNTEGRQTGVLEEEVFRLPSWATASSWRGSASPGEDQEASSQGPVPSGGRGGHSELAKLRFPTQSSRRGSKHGEGRE